MPIRGSPINTKNCLKTAIPFPALINYSYSADHVQAANYSSICVLIRPLECPGLHSTESYLLILPLDLDFKLNDASIAAIKNYGTRIIRNRYIKTK